MLYNWWGIEDERITLEQAAEAETGTEGYDYEDDTDMGEPIPPDEDEVGTEILEETPETPSEEGGEVVDTGEEAYETDTTEDDTVETEADEVQDEQPLEYTCPNCDTAVSPDMTACPGCETLLQPRHRLR